MTFLFPGARRTAATLALLAGAAVTAVTAPTVSASPADPEVSAANATSPVTVPADCEEYMYSAVTCQVWSEAMGRDIPVRVKPARTAGNNRVIQFLDGVHGGDGWSWRALPYVDDDDATIVFPVADSRSFWLDWDGPDSSGKQLQYETFMTEELPAYLETAFDVPGGGRDRTGVVGLSMGAYSAMNLAAKHPDMYRSVLALSGFYDNQSLIGRIGTDGTAYTHGEFNSGQPWDSEASRREDNPWLNVDNLTMPVHMAVATGIPHVRSDYPLGTTVEGAAIETATLGTTAAWDLWTRLHGRDNVHITYMPFGIHAYDTWINAAFLDQKLYWPFSAF